MVMSRERKAATSMLLRLAFISSAASGCTLRWTSLLDWLGVSEFADVGTRCPATAECCEAALVALRPSSTACCIQEYATQQQLHKTTVTGYRTTKYKAPATRCMINQQLIISTAAAAVVVKKRFI
eukprot:scpid87849/ scgid8765/ 